MINYIFEFSLLYGFCGICYLLIQQKTAYHFLRRFILLSLLLSLIVPFVPTFFQEGIQAFSIQLPEVLIGDADQLGTQTLESGFSWSNLFSFPNLIGLISGLLLLRLLFNSAKLVRMIGRSNMVQRDGYKLVYSKEVKNPCSFFGYILLPDPLHLTQDELDVVLKHEDYHIKFLHSFEKVLFEVTNIILWWHPGHFLFRKELSLIHEYEVDEAMLDHVKAKDYKEILLQLIINPPGLRMTNPFSSNIKKRIKMLNNKKQKSSKALMPFLGVFMVTTMLLIHSCTAQDVQPVSLSTDDIQSEESPSYTKELVDTIVTFDVLSNTEEMSIVNRELEVFKAPDELPLFPGCSETEKEALKECSQNKLLQYVYNNIVYPAEARDNKVEGMVVVKFVIGKDGVIETSEIVRSPGFGLSQAVTTMIYGMNQDVQWIPGKHNGKNVNVEYVLPVKFKLEGEEK